MITQEELEAYEDKTWIDILRPFAIFDPNKRLKIDYDFTKNRKSKYLCSDSVELITLTL